MHEASKVIEKLRARVHIAEKDRDSWKREHDSITASINSSPATPKKPKAPKPPQDPKNWKTKPTSVGNRQGTVQMTTVEKAKSSLWTIMALVLGLSTLAALGYLFTQL